MGIWVVVLEAVAIDGGHEAQVDPDDLDALAEELAASHPVITARPGSYSGELWVEEGNAGGAILSALLLWQTAVRAVGLPSWHVARAEARDAQALEMGLVDWPRAPEELDEAAEAELESRPVRIRKKATNATKAAKKTLKRAGARRLSTGPG
ncbi:MAG: hypothetical protein ACR2HY_10585 [Acidimicrobiales bacterium]